MNFEVKTILNAKTLVDYQRMAGKTVLRKRTLLQRGGLLGVGVAGLTICSVGLAQAGLNGAILFGILLSAIAFVMGLRWYQFQTWKLRNSVDEGFQQNFCFTEAGMSAQGGETKLAHPYSDIYAVAECDEYFCLFLSRRAGYILPKDGFQAGEAARFGAFIEEMTGKKIDQIKI